MSEFFDDDGLRGLWRQGDATLAALPLAEIKARAATFDRAIGRRNRREYAATLFVAVIFGLYALILPGWLLKAGSLFFNTSVFSDVSLVHTHYDLLDDGEPVRLGAPWTVRPAGALAAGIAW